MKFKEHDEARVRAWADKFSIPEHIAIIIANRLQHESEVADFLQPSLNQLFSPDLLPDIEILLTEVEKAIKEHALVLLYGHDDVDGFTSVLVLYEVLTDLGARVVYHIPHRIREGYFFNTELFEKYREDGVKLVLTADFGSCNARNFEVARAAGMRLVVTDHHEIVRSDLPGPTINPKRLDSRYPFRELAGVGVAYKVAQFLAQRMLNVSFEDFYSIKREMLGPLLLGTIADRVPLVSENRVYCHFGLEALRKSPRTVVRKLVARIPEGQFSFGSVLEEILPLISSAREDLGVRTFLINDDAEADQLINHLRHQNEQWQSRMRTVYDEVFASARVYDRIVISQLMHGPIGCLGSCATRLRDSFGRPALVIGFADNSPGTENLGAPLCVGELRGNEGSDLIAMLKSVGDILIDFGGHRKAAGFSMHRSSYDEFIEKARAFAEEKFSPADPAGNGHHKELAVDLAWPISRIDDSFRVLLPFGEGNPAPILADESGLVYSLDEDLTPIDPVRYAKIPRDRSGHVSTASKV